MTDYGAALKQGLSAYSLFENVQLAVREAVSDLSGQIEAATNGAVVIKWMPRTRPERTQTVYERMSLQPAPTTEYRALVAEGKTSQAELARLEMDQRAGWPVTLEYGTDVVFCHDRQALENAFATMLSQTRTGGILARLMPRSLPPPPE